MKRDQLCVISFVLAFVGLIYEFVFAQTLTIVFGNTYLQYALTIGIFTFGLGTGSLAFEMQKKKIKSPKKAFVKIQAILIPVCLFGLMIILFSESIFGSGFFAHVISYIPILGVAFLTGFELPLIMEMTDDPAASIEILSYDFGGMFVATVLFPFFFLPVLGVFATLNTCLILNLASLVYVLKPKKFAHRAYASGVLLVILMGFVFDAKLISYFGKILTD